MIDKYIEISNKFLNKKDIDYNSILEYHKEIQFILDVSNFFMIVINLDTKEILKTIDYDQTNINYSDSLKGKEYVFDYIDNKITCEELYYLINYKKPKQGKIALLSALQENIYFIYLSQLSDKDYKMYSENFNYFNISYSGMVLKYLAKIRSGAVNHYSGINFPLLINEMHNYIIICNEANNIIYCNKAVFSIFGAHLINTNINDIFRNEYKIIDPEKIQSENEEKILYYLPEIGKYYELTHQKIDEYKNQSYNIFIFFDVSHNEIVKKDLNKKSENVNLQLKALDEIAVIDIRDEFGVPIYNNKSNLFLNENELVLTAYKPQELEFLDLETRIEIVESIRARKSWRGTIRVPLKTKKEMWLNSTVIPMYSESGVRIVSISLDITNEKKQQEEIKKLASAVEFSPISIVITDQTGNIEFVNSKYLEMNNVKEEDVIGKSFLLAGANYINESTWAEMLSYVSTGNTWQGVINKKDINGNDLYDDVSISSIKDENGVITNLVAITEDVTSKINMQKEITKTNTLLETINETTSEGIIVFDKDGSIIIYNKEFLNLMNLRYENIRILNELDIFNLLENSVINIMSYSDTIDKIIYDKDIKIQFTIDLINNKVYEINAMPFILDGLTVGRMWTLRDISERAEYEEKLRNTNLQLTKAKELFDEQAKKLEINLKELEEVKMQMEKAANIKTEFIANVSHEIRTPLNSIIGYADILMEDKLTAKQAEFMLYIINAGKNLLLLINDIIEISKFSNYDLQNITKPIFIDKFLKAIYLILKDKINPTLVNFSINLDENFPNSIFLDEVRLRQILINIIGNSIKFTSVGEIEVQFSILNSDPKNNTIDFSIEISDSGIGIPQEYIESIFMPFYQLNTNDSKKYSGAGIGLAVVKKQIDIMNGEVKISSEENVGTTFEITFKNVKVNKDSTALIENEYSNNSDENIIFNPANILICDDIIVNHTLVKSQLRNHPIKIFFASNGKEAIEIFKNENISLILMDFSMEEMNGDEVANYIKTEIDPNVKIILTSGVNYSEKNFDKKLFNDYLDKPFSKSQLYALLKKYLSYSEREYEDNLVQKSIEIFKVKEIFVKEKEIEKAKAFESVIINEFYKEWQFIYVSRILSNIKDFSEKLLTFTEENDLFILLYYAQTLRKQVNSYDIENMNDTLNFFPELLQKHKFNIVSEGF